MPLQALVNCSSFALVLICFVLKSLGFSITSTFHDLNGAHQERWRVPFLSGVALSATNSAIYLRPRPSRVFLPLPLPLPPLAALVSCAYVNFLLAFRSRQQEASRTCRGRSRAGEMREGLLGAASFIWPTNLVLPI